VLSKTSDDASCNNIIHIEKQMNKLLFITLALILLVVFVQAADKTAPAKKKAAPKWCSTKCFKKVSVSTEEPKDKKKAFKSCVSKCFASKRVKKGIQAKPVKAIKVQKEAGAKVESDAPVYPETDSESFAPKSGASVQATTAVNIRSGPCTSNSVVRTLQSGQTVQFTGQVKSGCGYTWYSVSGGWAASNYLKEVGSGGGSTGGSTCKTRSYPLYKQCDGRWGSNSLGSRTVCAIGCLMSSVSMALNGLGKSVNGQSANPGTLNSFLKSNGGYSGNLFMWGAVSRYGLRYEGQPTSSSSIKSAICANKVVILNVNHGGHWVLATGVTSSGYTVNDPGFSRSSYTFGEVVRAGVYAV
jgi:hypothetical protein